MEWLLFLLLFAVAFNAGAAEAPGKDATKDPLPACFGELTEVPLPKSLKWARDVRWMGGQEVAIAAVQGGVLRLNLDNPAKPPVSEVAVGGRHSSTRSPWTLGASKDYLVVGSAMLAVGWKTPGAAGLTGEDYFEFIQDLDVRGNQLLVLGLRKNEDGTAYEEDGAFAWLGPLTGPNLKTMQPVAFSADGSSARAMNDCGATFVGAARFLEDGSFLVVPITEPGVFLFRANGRLARTWQNQDFGLDSGCGLSEELRLRIGVDLDLRMKWINQRTLVDDILPLGGGRFGLLVRQYKDGVLNWRIEIADATGRLSSCTVPITVASRWVHLRLDRQGKDIALLQMTRFDSLQTKGPVTPPHLFVTSLGTTSPTQGGGEPRVPNRDRQE